MGCFVYRFRLECRFLTCCGPSRLGGLQTTVEAVTRLMPPLKIIASGNGLQAAKSAFNILRDGRDALDACVAAATIVEDDPDDTSVGFGGLPNEEGIVELDAAVMHGPTHRAGGVAALRCIRNPTQVARQIMEATDHALLVGNGALQFAKAVGFREEDLLTDRARKIWLHWKRTLSDRHDWVPPDPNTVEPEIAEFFARPTGTVHFSAIDQAGNMSCATSTSGLAFKLPGRVGDSPIIGAGLYVDNEVGSAGSTGRGEASLINLTSFLAVELMRQGLAPLDAAIEVLRRMERRTEARLRNERGEPRYDLQIYVLRKDGVHAGACMRGPKRISIVDERGGRHEQCEPLYSREP
jgi:N4-(beta-N-acetylglucosaminyl)-L-asparaginase